MEIKEKYTYVIGGMYGSQADGKKFGLVHPSGTDRPYFTHNPNSSTLRIGNSYAALYVIDFDKGILRKQPDPHYEQKEAQPDVVTLTDSMVKKLRETIEAGDTYIA